MSLTCNCHGPFESHIQAIKEKVFSAEKSTSEVLAEALKELLEDYVRVYNCIEYDSWNPVEINDCVIKAKEALSRYEVTH